MATAPRLPLKETNGNIPSPVLKKARISRGPGLVGSLTNRPVLTPTNLHNVRAGSGTNTVAAAGGSKTTTLVGEELVQWQADWRRIMKVSTAYFDTQGCDANSVSQQNEQKRAGRALRMVGCNLARFYDRDVTIIISRRPYNAQREYPSNDIFHDAQTQKIKVWNYDKVFRFLKNIGVDPNATNVMSTSTAINGASTTTAPAELYNLLKEEKIFGANDRDPNARRDDLHYLERNYLYVYDLSQTVRPIAVREWSDHSYPVLSLTLDGKCPFILEAANEQNLERRKLRRIQKFEASKTYRELLKQATLKIVNDGSNHLGELGSSCSTDRTVEQEEDEETRGEVSQVESEGDVANQEVVHVVEDEEEDVTTVQPSTYFFKAPLARQSSVLQANDSNSKYFEAAASGFNGASNAAQCLMDSTLNSNAVGNGLGPSVSQVPSKNVNNLKRRIFMKKQKQKQSNNHHFEKEQREMKPGYCENCRVKYDHFDDHILTNRHRNFACDNKNFKDIDDLIFTLNESKKFGFVTSNGDWA